MRGYKYTLKELEIINIIESNNMPAIQNLLKFRNPRKRLSNGFTLLHIAARKSKVDVVKYLLEKKIDINSRNVDGITPIFISVVYNNYHVTNYLKEAGAIEDIESYKKIGFVPKEYEKPEDVVLNEEEQEFVNQDFYEKEEKAEVKNEFDEILTNPYTEADFEQRAFRDFDGTMIDLDQEKLAVTITKGSHPSDLAEQLIVEKNDSHLDLDELYAAGGEHIGKISSQKHMEDIEKYRRDIQMYDQVSDNAFQFGIKYNDRLFSFMKNFKGMKKMTDDYAMENCISFYDSSPKGDGKTGVALFKNKLYISTKKQHGAIALDEITAKPTLENKKDGFELHVSANKEYKVQITHMNGAEEFHRTIEHIYDIIEEAS